MTAKNPFLGPTLQEFFEETGEWEEVVAMAEKERVAEAIRAEMRRKRITEVQLAKLMHTSRSSVRRILDPKQTTTGFNLVSRALSLMGKRLAIVDASRPAKRAMKAAAEKKITVLKKRARPSSTRGAQSHGAEGRPRRTA